MAKIQTYQERQVVRSTPGIMVSGEAEARQAEAFALLGSTLTQEGTQYMQKVRESEHVANYHKANLMATEGATSLINGYQADPSKYLEHATNFESEFLKLRSEATKGITDQRSLDAINMHLDGIQSRGMEQTRQISRNQQIDNVSAIGLESMEFAVKSGDAESIKSITRDLYNAGIIGKQQAVKLELSKTREARINGVESMINANPGEAINILLTAPEATELAPDDVNTMLSKAISTYNKLEAMQDDQNQKIEDEAMQRILDQIDDGNYAGAADLAERYGNARVLDPQTRQSVNKMINSGPVTDSIEYIDLLDRVLQGENMRQSIMSSDGINLTDKKALLKQNYEIQAGGSPEGKQALKQSFNTMKSYILTTGPTAQFVKQDEQIALQEMYNTLTDRIAAGENAETVTRDLINDYFKTTMRVPATRYGAPRDLTSIDAFARRLAQEYNAGTITKKQADNQAELILTAKEILERKERLNKETAP